MTPFQLFFCGWLAVACLYAFLLGGTPERIVAGIFVVGAVLSRQVEVSRVRPFHSLEIGILHVDLAMFGLFIGLALLTTRFWPMAMASLQGTQVLGHFAHLIDHGTLPRAYFALAVLWSLPMLMLLAIGTWRHRRRRNRYGRDYSWAWQLPEAYHNGASCGELRQGS